jgi:hypothetical protein
MSAILAKMREFRDSANSCVTAWSYLAVVGQAAHYLQSVSSDEWRDIPAGYDMLDHIIERNHVRFTLRE